MNAYISNLNYKSSKLLLVLFSALVFCNSVKADELSELPTGTYNVDLSHASVVWKVSHLGLSTYVGRFIDFDASLSLDTEDFTKSSVDVNIKVDSIDTAYPWPEKEDFDKKLATDWFNSAEHPIINFTSTSVAELSDNKSTVTGDLTFNGVTKPVTLDITLNNAMKQHPFIKKPVIGFSGSTKIDRTEWGVSKYAPNIGAEVIIELEGEFIQAGE